MLSGLQEVSDVAPLNVAQRLVGMERKQLAEPENGVHRGAQLVAHTGEELGPGIVRRFRRFIGPS